MKCRPPCDRPLVYKDTKGSNKAERPALAGAALAVAGPSMFGRLHLRSAGATVTELDSWAAAGDLAAYTAVV